MPVQYRGLTSKNGFLFKGFCKGYDKGFTMEG